MRKQKEPGDIYDGDGARKCSSVVEQLSRVHEALGSIPSTRRKERKSKRKEEEREGGAWKCLVPNLKKKL
jgi:hypothetical protein